MNIKLHTERPNLIVLVGVPASGKSTWRDNFIAKMETAVDDDFVIISSDDEIEALCEAEGITYTEGFSKFVGKATAIVKQKVRDAVNNGRNIIWDQTNVNVKKRKTIFRDTGQNYYRIAVAFELDDDAELKRRLQHREETTGKSIPPHVIDSMLKSYVRPTTQEGFDKVHLA
jgi:predicted kinase